MKRIIFVNRKENNMTSKMKKKTGKNIKWIRPIELTSQRLLNICYNDVKFSLFFCDFAEIFNTFLFD